MDFVKHEYENLCYTVNVWCREVMIRIAETKHQLPIPLAIDRELQQVGHGFKTSVDSEYQINHLRACQRTQRSNKFGRVSRWHQLLSSNVPLLKFA